MTSELGDLVDLLDFSWLRLRDRLSGLSDDEYVWEPVPGCYTVRRGADGRWRPDRGYPQPDPAPVATIAWRIWHITNRAGVGQTWPLLTGSWDVSYIEPPPTAAEAVERVRVAHEEWRNVFDSVDRKVLSTPIGELGQLAHDYGGGAYAARTVRALLLHTLDEHVHHSAEIALLRDLYLRLGQTVAFHSPYHEDPLIDACLRGDQDTLRSLLEREPDRVEAALATHPDAVNRAVAVAGPPAIRQLAELGFAVRQVRPVAPVHQAASIDDVEALAALVDLGGDPSEADGIFHSDALGWAKYLGCHRATAWLTEHLTRTGASF